MSETTIHNAKPAVKEYTIADGQGLSVRGAAKRHQAVALPLQFLRQAQELRIFPDVGLKAAREKRHDTEKLRDQGRTGGRARG